MGKWIAGLVVLCLFVIPSIYVVAGPEEPLANVAMGWFMPKQESALGQKYAEDIRTRQFSPVVNDFERQYVTPAMPGQLAKIADLFPKEKPKSIKLVGSNWVMLKDSTTYNLTYEYEFAHAWVTASIAMTRTGGKLRIHGVTVTPASDSIEHVNALTLRGKSQGHLIFAAAAALMFAFWMITVFVCLFTPITRLKWLWVIFVCLGFAGLNLNWTTGELHFVLWSVAVPAVRAWHNFYAPWTVQIALPLGAIVFWLRRGYWIAESKGLPANDLRA